MPINQTEIFTKVITNTTYIISATSGFRSASFFLFSGVGTFSGNLTVGADASTAVSLVVNQAVTLSSDGSNSLGQVDLDCSAGGVIHLICKQ